MRLERRTDSSVILAVLNVTVRMEAHPAFRPSVSLHDFYGKVLAFYDALTATTCEQLQICTAHSVQH